MSSAPRLWISIASHDRPEELAKQAAACLEQMGDDDVLNVVVDGGPVPTLPQDLRISLTVLAQNRGVNHARRLANAGLPLSGSVCVELDDHDTLHAGALDAIRKAFSDPSVSFVYGDYESYSPETDKRLRVTKPSYKPWAFQERCHAAGLAAYRGWLYTAAGGWPTAYPGGDMVLYMRMEAVLDAKGIVRLPVILNDVCLDKGGITHTAGNKQAENGAAESIRLQGVHDPAGVKVLQMPTFERQVVVEKPKAPTPAHGLTTKTVSLTPKDGGNASPRGTQEQPVAPTQLRPLRPKPLALICHVKWQGAVDFGGGERSSTHWLLALEKAGFETRVVVTNDSDGNALPEYAERVDGKELGNRVRELLPDIMIVVDGMNIGRATVATEPMIVVAQELGIPIIVRMQFWRGFARFETKEQWYALHHPETEERFGETLDQGGVRSLWESDGVIVNSEFCADKVSAALCLPRAEVEWPRIESEPILVPTADRKPEYIVAVDGSPLKGAETFLELARAFPDERFAVCKPVKAIAKKIESAPNVEDWGRVTDMRTVYAKAKIVYIATKTAETFCRCGAEAKANGIPLLLSDSGNLPSFAGHMDRVVPLDVGRDCPLSVWRDALKSMLAQQAEHPEMECKLDWCNAEVTVLPRMAATLVAGRGIVVVCAERAPGVSAAMAHLSAATGVRIVDSCDATPEAIGNPAALMLAGGMNPEYAAMARACSCPVGLSWHSHNLQMELSPRELNAFDSALDLAGELGERLTFLPSYGPMAPAWHRAYGVSAMWMPEALSFRLLPAMRDTIKGAQERRRAVALLGPAGGRKNLSTIALAARQAGYKIIASKWLQKDATTARMLVRTMGPDIEWVDMPKAADVVELLGSVRAFVAAGVGETFSYAAAFAMAAGTPVVGSHLTPVCAYEPGKLELVLDRNIADPGDISDALLRLDDEADWQAMSDATREHIVKVARCQNDRAAETLRALKGEG